MDKLKYSDFIAYMKSGHEIEICFRGKWYFFGTHKLKNNRGTLIRTYMFYEMYNDKLNNIAIFNDLEKLLQVKIQNCDLSYALDELQDYVIF